MARRLWRNAEGRLHRQSYSSTAAVSHSLSAAAPPTAIAVAGTTLPASTLSNNTSHISSPSYSRLIHRSFSCTTVGVELLQRRPCCGMSNDSIRTTLPSTRRGHKSSATTSDECISVTFIEKDGEEVTVDVPLGTNLLEAAHDNDIELEGACEGSLACSTCHVNITVVPTPF